MWTRLNGAIGMVLQTITVGFVENYTNSKVAPSAATKAACETAPAGADADGASRPAAGAQDKGRCPLGPAAFIIEPDDADGPAGPPSTYLLIGFDLLLLLLTMSMVVAAPNTMKPQSAGVGRALFD